MECKYRAINKYTISSLVNSELYFASPETLNDPFDCSVEIPKALEAAISLAKGATKDLLIKLRNEGEYFGTIQDMLLRYGVCSFSTDETNPLLWSHYSDEHRGLCLMYDIPDSFIVSGTDKVAGISPVACDENPLRDWFLGISTELIAGGKVKFGFELMKKLFLVKLISQSS